MEHSVAGYVHYVSMWFNTKFVRVPIIINLPSDEQHNTPNRLQS